jgi:RimJ/RimL family protein N-acetyltransferase
MSTIEPRQITTKSGRTVTIRSATGADAEELLALYLDVRTTADQTTVRSVDEGYATVDETKEEIRAFTAHGSRLNLVCVDGDAVIGEISFQDYGPRRMAHRGRLGISVRSDSREQWIGRELVRTVLDWARTHPEIERIDLGVFAHNHRAIAVYKKMGFVEVARRDKEFKVAPGVYWDDIQMELWVRPPSTPVV